MRRYRRNPDAAGRIIDGLAFVVTPADSKLHTLNGAATRLWTRAGATAISVDDAAADLVEIYDVDAATAARDAAACLEDLVARGVLLAEEGGGDAALPVRPEK
jgi:hypothetical protein